METLAERLEIDIECIGIGRTKLIYGDYMVSKFCDTYDMAVPEWGRFNHLKKSDVIKKIIQMEDVKGRTQAKKNWKL
jgi:hypothetical protein